MEELQASFSVDTTSHLKIQSTFKDQARTDEKGKHTWEYVSILKRFATL